MESIIVSIIMVAIVTAIITRPGAERTIRTLFEYFVGSIKTVLGTK